MQLLINLNLASLRLFPSCFLRCGLHWQPTSNKLTEIGQRGKGCRGRSCTGQAPGTPRSRSGRGRGFWKKKKKKRKKKGGEKVLFCPPLSATNNSGVYSKRNHRIIWKITISFLRCRIRTSESVASSTYPRKPSFNFKLKTPRCANLMFIRACVDSLLPERAIKRRVILQLLQCLVGFSDSIVHIIAKSTFCTK